MIKVKASVIKVIFIALIAFAMVIVQEPNASISQENNALTLIEMTTIESEGGGGYLNWSSNGQYLTVATSAFSIYEDDQLIYRDDTVLGNGGSFSPNNRYFAHMGYYTLSIRDMESFDIIYESPNILTSERDWLSSIAFNPSGSRLAASYSDETIMVLNLSDMDNIEIETIHKPEDAYNYLAWISFINDEEIVGVADSDSRGVVTRFNIDSDFETTTQLLGKAFTGATVDMEYLLTGESSGISIFRISEDNLYNEIMSVNLTGEAEFIRHPIFLMDRKYIAVPGGFENTMIIVDSHTGHIVWNVEFEASEAERPFLGGVAFDPVNNRLAASRTIGSAEGTKTITTIWHVTD